MEWPQQSLDLDPIENLWTELKVHFHKQFMELCGGASKSLEVRYCRKYGTVRAWSWWMSLLSQRHIVMLLSLNKRRWTKCWVHQIDHRHVFNRCIMYYYHLLLQCWDLAWFFHLHHCEIWAQLLSCAGHHREKCINDSITFLSTIGIWNNWSENYCIVLL